MTVAFVGRRTCSLFRILSNINAKQSFCKPYSLFTGISSKMVVPTHSEDLDKLRMQVKKQGDIVRKLKEESASESDIKKAVVELKAYKKMLETEELHLLSKDPKFDRGKLEDLLRQKFFYDQAFSIYGGIQGLYDYGPMGCAMKANILQAWRQFFILNDHLLEVDCSMLTPEPVLQASGHVDRFTDWMVRDVDTGECHRADHLIKNALEALGKLKKTSEAQRQEIERILSQLDNFDGDELNSVIRQYNLKSPNTQNGLTEPQRFNLMFSTTIGPTGQCKGYLRPETAQGIFVNFQRLLQFNQGRLPFGAAQIGSAFRNEISPRSGLLRVREFCMAEIEYFVDPTNKNHPKFNSVQSLEMCIFSSNDQMDGNQARKMTIGDAVEQGIVANETLGYFMARIQLFLVHIGVDRNRLRFRQHLGNEMAHYACDCWDAECLTSYGWIECVGCADRSCYDLTQHTKATGVRLVAEKQLPKPHTVQICECIPNKAALGKAFKADAKSIIERLASLDLNEAQTLKKQMQDSSKISLDICGKSLTLESSMITFKEREDVVHVEEIVPNVIEPSFGIGRILYTVFEHSFRVREEDEQRTYLSIPPVLAPYKCSILPLSNNPDFGPIIQQLSTALTKCNVSHRIDESSGSIGRRYARTDQIAIPFGITIDFDTINTSPMTATLRERDSMVQIRVPVDKLPNLVSDLSTGLISWDEARSLYPIFEQQETVQESQLQKERPSNSPKSEKQHPVNKPDSSIKDAQNSERDHNNLPTKTEDPDLDVWSSATDEPHELNKSKQTSESKVNLPGKPQGKQEQTVRDPDTQNPNPETLSWTSWGKAIRKRYQEEEEREKRLQKHSQRQKTDREELKSTNSGYEADQEDNVGQKSAIPLNSTEPSYQIDESRQKHGTESDAVCTKSSSPSSRQAEVPYHGIFVGDGWPGSKPKTPPKVTTVITKNTRNVSTQPRCETTEVELDKTRTHITPGIQESTIQPKSAAFIMDCDSLDSEMKQLLESNAHLHRFPLSSNAKAVKVNQSHCTSVHIPNVNRSPECIDRVQYHGLFVGSGWPAVKHDKSIKLPLNEDNMITTQQNATPLTSPKPSISPISPKALTSDESNLDHRPSPVQQLPNTWNSTFSRIDDNLLDSEQWQLQLAEPTGSFKFGPNETSINTQPSSQNFTQPEVNVSSLPPPESSVTSEVQQEQKLVISPTPYKHEAIPSQPTAVSSVTKPKSTKTHEMSEPRPDLKPASPVIKTTNLAHQDQQCSSLSNLPEGKVDTVHLTPTPVPDASAQGAVGTPTPEPSTDTMKKKSKKRKPKKKTH